MTANLPICHGCRYRLPATHSCELGVVDKPNLCPRSRPRVRVPLTDRPPAASFSGPQPSTPQPSTTP